MRPTLPTLARISDYPGHWAAERPAAEAMVLDDTRLSWRDLTVVVDRCARALLAAGVGRGDRVAMLAPPRPESMICFLAAARIGAIWAGLNLRLLNEELSYILGDSEPCLLVAIRR